MTAWWPTLALVDRSRKGEEAKDPRRCQAEAARRAKVTLRRFCTEHRLRYMWTLTYRGDGEHDISKVRRHVEKLIAKIANNRNGQRFPYVWVPEQHPSGHGIHVHMAVPFFYKHSNLVKAWGRGFVYCTDMKKPGECGMVGCRRAVTYLSKYLGKAFEDAGFGRHRYERAQGFEPYSYKVSRFDLQDGEEYACIVFRTAPTFVWRSESIETWAGPPCRVLFFAGRAPDD